MNDQCLLTYLISEPITALRGSEKRARLVGVGCSSVTERLQAQLTHLKLFQELYGYSEDWASHESLRRP